MDITINEIKLFQILKEKLGEKEAETLVTFVETKVKQESEQHIKTLATKEDLLKTKIDLIKWVFAFFVTLMLAILGLYFKH